MKDAPTRRFIRASALADLLTVSKATVQRWEQAGRLPARYELGPGVVAFSVDEVDRWLEQRRRA